LVSDLRLSRLGCVMEPERDNVQEAEGVLNPAGIRGPDGHYYLFPRLVGPGNYSRIGIARVRFDAAGDPVGVVRVGLALEPEANYERGGCEDPRLSFVEPLGCYIMSYTAFSPDGPRLALAASDDLMRWRRLGPVDLKMEGGLIFAGVDDKDFSLFPRIIRNADGAPSLAILHRPRLSEECRSLVSQSDAERGAPPLQCIWLSYCALADGPDSIPFGAFTHHHRLAAPEQPWEMARIGSGTPWLAVNLSWCGQ
jgi:predicted GH43/DUF377 family glycosyl hydrolase